jgi:hypothetical protein
MTDPQAAGVRPATAIIRGPADALARVILDICQPPARREPPADRDDADHPDREEEPC